jgi:predicted dehydrogenase/threonine dehydrogenase-like Zn-dependent dehydrogenase
MKQLAQYQDGRLELQDVPQPTAPAGGILVRVTHSVISVGTEKMKVEQARMNLLQKARARPDQVRKVLDTAKTLGWRSAIDKVKNRLEIPSPLGYSAAGQVVAVDTGNSRFSVGDRVAIGGAECAFHAEYVAVPDMLAAAIPEGVENWQAAYTTIVSIAMQAVRQVNPTLGERVMVVGQGLIGVLVTALLHANGARVMAVDVAPARRTFAKAMGAEEVVILGEQDLSQHVRTWTEGFGVDAVVLATASAANAPTEQALQALRDRGRIVVVGKTKVDLIYEYAFGKEIDLRFSRSYGPGRYDPNYEWGAVDYPIGYVRWTEQRNFDACLHQMKSGALDLRALTTKRAPFTQALEVYQDLLGEGAAREAGVVLEYETAAGAADIAEGSVATLEPKPHLQAVRDVRLDKPVSRVDVIGAGNFARTMLLPHLRDRITLGTVVNNTSLSANHARQKFGFTHAATDHRAALSDTASAGVIIATRHHLHAPFVLESLEAGRHVFVEKPLCRSTEELAEIEAALVHGGSVQIGFNRRFSAAGAQMKKLLASTPGPKSASYRVMAGALDPSHWYANYAESGGRILGEVCHFLDFFCFLFGSAPKNVRAQALWPASGRLPFVDSVAVQVEFDDGSCGQLVYSAEGDSTWPKEICTVFGAGITMEMENFQKLVVSRNRKRTASSYTGKGHTEQMHAWTAFLRGETPHPVPFEQSKQSMLLTFAVLDALRGAAQTRPESGVPLESGQAARSA